MSILDKLNSEFQIEVKDNVAYDMQEKNNIIATNEQELIQFYIDSYKYKMECLFDDEETKNYYKRIIEQLEKISE